MNWLVGFHRQALKFLIVNKISQDEITEIIKKVLRKFQGEDININIAKLKGEWTGFYRIKIGKLRIIADFNFDKKRVYIEVVDWRGSAYK